MTFLDCLNSPKCDFKQNQSGSKMIKFQQSSLNFTFWKFLEHSAAGFLLWCLCFIIADILAYILDILSKRVREIHHALPLSVSNTLNSEYRTTTPLYLLSIWVFFWCQNTVVCEDDQVIINFVSFICRTICLVLSRYRLRDGSALDVSAPDFSARLFQPQDFSAPRLFSPKTFQPLDFSAPRCFSPKTFQPQIFSAPDLSAPRLFSPKTFQLLDFSAPGLFSPRCFSPCYFS